MNCPNCGSDNCTTKNPSHPVVNVCNNCKFDWNPDNTKPPFVVKVSTFIAEIRDKMGYLDHNLEITEDRDKAKVFTLKMHATQAVETINYRAFQSHNPYWQGTTSIRALIQNK
jgi:hypothetical protein